MIYLQHLSELPEILWIEGDPVQAFTREYFGIFDEQDGLLAVVGVIPHGTITATATLWFALIPDVEPAPSQLRWAKQLCKVLLQCLPYEEIRAEAIVGDQRGKRFLQFLDFRFAGILGNRRIYVGDKT